jgi:hypothetical protein
MTTREETAPPPDEAVEQAARAICKAFWMDNYGQGENSPLVAKVVEESWYKWAKQARAVLSIPYVEKLTRERDEAQRFAEELNAGWAAQHVRAEAAEARVGLLEDALADTMPPCCLSIPDCDASHNPSWLCCRIRAALSSSDAPRNEN